jgi:hypothetical protein
MTRKPSDDLKQLFETAKKQTGKTPLSEVADRTAATIVGMQGYLRWVEQAMGASLSLEQLFNRLTALVSPPSPQDGPQFFGANASAFKEPFRPAAMRGEQEMTYSYASDNPEAFTDPNGDAPGVCLTTYDCCLQQNAEKGWAYVEEQCGPPPNCRSQKAFCVLKCNETNPPGPGKCNQGQPTLKCIADCMVSNGCNG